MELNLAQMKQEFAIEPANAVESLLVSRGAALLAAVEALLGLHESAEILSLTHDGHLDYDGDVLRVYCTACTSDDVKELIGDCEWTEDDEVVGWPCPTVEAITAALEAS